MTESDVKLVVIEGKRAGIGPDEAQTWVLLFQRRRVLDSGGRDHRLVRVHGLEEVRFDIAFVGRYTDVDDLCVRGRSDHRHECLVDSGTNTSRDLGSYKNHRTSPRVVAWFDLRRAGHCHLALSASIVGSVVWPSELIAFRDGLEHPPNLVRLSFADLLRLRRHLTLRTKVNLGQPLPAVRLGCFLWRVCELTVESRSGTFDGPVPAPRGDRASRARSSRRRSAPAPCVERARCGGATRCRQRQFARGSQPT